MFCGAKPSGQGFRGLCCGPNPITPLLWELREAVCPHLTTWPLPHSCFLAVGFNHPHRQPLSLTDPFLKSVISPNKSISLSLILFTWGKSWWANLKTMGEGPEINERWKFILESYREILGCNFTLSLFLLPPSPSFISLVFSSLSSFPPLHTLSSKR